jgi:hypothetical protein
MSRIQATSVSCDLSGWHECDRDGPFGEFAFVEHGAVAYECDQMCALTARQRRPTPPSALQRRLADTGHSVVRGIRCRK